MPFEKLFSPVQIGALHLKNRIVMAPLTRARADEGNVPQPVMAEYYAQRADCGLIISEATAVARVGMGWYRAPGVWTEEMVAGWRVVTDAVHAAGGLILCQLWHMGRLVLPDYLDGALPIGPSAIAGVGETMAPRERGNTELFLPMKHYVVPRVMTQEDIDEAIAAFRLGAANAMRAGFDGVEVHGANGYLIDQFLQSQTNQRDDQYGGTVANRVRFLREVFAAVVQEVPGDRIGVRISPTSERKGMGDVDPEALAEEIGRAAKETGIAYIHLIEPIASGFMEKPKNPVGEALRASFGGTIIQNGSFDPRNAEEYIAAGRAEAISFGRPYLANPDLVTRFRTGRSLSEANFDYAYVGEEKGYTDYPLSQA